MLDPYPCPRCGIRLQWIISFEDDRSWLSIIEFDSSQPHTCPRRGVARIRRIAPPPKDPIAEALSEVARTQRDGDAALSRHMESMQKIADDTRKTLIAAGTLLKSARGNHLPQSQTASPGDHTRPNKGGI